MYSTNCTINIEIDANRECVTFKNANALLTMFGGYCESCTIYGKINLGLGSSIDISDLHPAIVNRIGQVGNTVYITFTLANSERSIEVKMSDCIHAYLRYRFAENVIYTSNQY